MATQGQTDANLLLQSSRCMRCLPPQILAAVQTYLIVDAVGLTTDPTELIDLSKCFKCLPRQTLVEVKAYLLAVIAGFDTDPNALLARSRCYDCIPGGLIAEVQTWMFSLDPSGPGTSDPNTLAGLARQLQDLSPDTLLEIQVYALAVSAGASTDPNALALAAKCMKCIPEPAVATVTTEIINFIEDATGDTGGGGGLPPVTPPEPPLCDENVAPVISNLVYGTNAVGEENVLLTFDAGTLCVCHGGNAEWVFYGSQFSDGTGGVEFNSLPIAGGGAFAENVAMPLPTPPYLYVYITVRCTGFESPISNVVPIDTPFALTVGVLAHDDFEDYNNGDLLNFLRGGTNWSGPYIDQISYWRYYAVDDMESYTAGVSATGLNGGTGWAGPYASA